MAQSIDSRTLGVSRVGEHAYSELWKLRLVSGEIILFAAVVELFSVSWDIQWHTAVGRDRTLTMPHLFILGGIVVMGLTALAAVLTETVWARRRPALAQGGTAFAGFFSSSLGAYLAGYGALDAAIAFPLDQYWHTLYGVDVTIWAPFHIMLLAGFSVICLGIVYMLAEGSRLAEAQGAKGAARVGYVGMIVACATLLGALSILLPNALSTGYISLGNLVFTVYPLMLGAFSVFVFMMAIRALPWRGAATSVAVIYVLLGAVTYLIVPLLMTLNLSLEQQNLLPHASTASVMAIEWQYYLIIPAVLLDVVAWVAQRQRWPLRRLNWAIGVTASVGVSLAALLNPFFRASLRRFGGNLKPGNAALSEAALKARGVVVQAGQSHQSVIMIVVVSLLLGLLGVFIGQWFGTIVGASMRGKAHE